eukprot:363239-Chlamydomonas_euryale.AAC.18
MMWPAWMRRYVAEQGDVIVGRVSEISGKRWKVDLRSRQEAALLLSAVDLPGGVQRRRNAEDELNMRRCVGGTAPCLCARACVRVYS